LNPGKVKIDGVNERSFINRWRHLASDRFSDAWRDATS
jgi:hypothetical protein